MNPDRPGVRVFTVSELTVEIKSLLETKYPFVWLMGEVSNLRIPPSGHCYFTLKDDQAQIQAVVFKNQMRGLKFEPENGTMLKGIGRISVFEPRGTYQVVFEYLEPKGAGALQLAFEQLKKRLFDQGLFDEARKKPLPFLPKHIAVVTSPAGAALQDILHIAGRRFPGMKIQVSGVKVQGDGAEHEIAQALEKLNQKQQADVIILARGGGSLEDLQPFNTEVVARAIYASKIPVVSAVGHETDFTIADFAADLRAPTPSAAAELVVPVRDDLAAGVNHLHHALVAQYKAYISRLRARLREAAGSLRDPRRVIIDTRLRLDDLCQRLHQNTSRIIFAKEQKLQFEIRYLYSNNPNEYITKYNGKLEDLTRQMQTALGRFLTRKKESLNLLNEKLSLLNPTAILNLGYSITRSLPNGAIVRDASRVKPGQDVRVQLAKGELLCRIERTIPHE